MVRPGWPFIVAALLPLAGCGETSSERTFSGTRVATAPAKPWRAGATSADRFGSPFRRKQAGHQAHGAAKAPLAYVLPDGWHSEPASGSRLLTFHVGGGHDAECSVVHLSGKAGGDLANVNRWRKQMGEAPIDAAGLAQLPRREVLGGEAVCVELSGTFTGMDGRARAGQTLLGLMVPCNLPGQGQGTLFIKLVGPSETVAAEAERFWSFCASLKPGKASGGEEHSEHDGHDHGSEAAGPPTSPLPTLSWSQPEGWVRGPDRNMRAVTYAVGGDPAAECYVSILRGPAGGVVANVDRWRRQLGKPPLGPDGVKSLPTIPMLGLQAPLVEVEGTFTGMGGTQAKEGYAMLGVVGQLEEATVFVKLVGPAAQVRGARDAFVAFCGSLEQTK